MKLTKKIAKKVGDKIKVNWAKISLDSFLVGMNIETEHSDLLPSKHNRDNYDLEDYIFFGKIAHSHLKESPEYYKKLIKMEKTMKEVVNKIVKFLLKESKKNDKNYYHKMMYELNKDNDEYQKIYNTALGKFLCDHPDQLEKKQREEFYDFVEKEINANISQKKTGDKKILVTNDDNMKKEDYGSDADLGQNTINNTFSLPRKAYKKDTQLEEAPPGREKQVKKLKKVFKGKDESIPYKIAWSQEKDRSEQEIDNSEDIEKTKMKNRAYHQNMIN